MSALDEELLSFASAIRHLGAAVVITECAGRIHRHLNHVKIFFRDNLRQLNEINNSATQKVNAETREEDSDLFFFLPEYHVGRLPDGLDGLADELMRFKCVSAYSCDVP